jgi:hypothetical protein
VKEEEEDVDNDSRGGRDLSQAVPVVRRLAWSRVTTMVVVVAGPMVIANHRIQATVPTF